MKSQTIEDNRVISIIEMELYKRIIFLPKIYIFRILENENIIGWTLGYSNIKFNSSSEILFLGEKNKIFSRRKNKLSFKFFKNIFSLNLYRIFIIYKFKKILKVLMEDGFKIEKSDNNQILLIKD